ncbi:putative lipoprotein [Leptospira weilii serovar Topaz str. LT2116]|uniref:Putative lipoprotein n=1 Tax=Leptospira weilii serovar Topaz str. LT2116 TaxID=1088540 RepID=M3G2N3_9LEPT|nr:putative lipoprotein [Leptospira weilii serovar Topaz str. LT2116]
MKFSIIKNLNIIIVLLVLSACKDDRIKISDLGVIDKDKKNQTAFVLQPEKLLVMVRTDSDLDGKTDLWTWVRGDDKNPKASLVLFEELIRKGNHSRTWYGPGNRKLIEQNDLDEDGRWESMVYYNASATPKETMRIVAHVEVDLYGKGKPSLWIFPEARMELDLDDNGKPDHLLTKQELMLENFAKLQKGKEISKKDFSPMSASSSWVFNSKQIVNPRYQALINQSLFPVDSKPNISKP